MIVTEQAAAQTFFARDWYIAAMERLVSAVQELSQARTLEAIAVIVRRAARELTGADGATFILRDGEQCHYLDEDAISPLWKGQRFPMKACISGWVMLNAEPALIEDIYADPRIPVQAYRPTFVTSLAMVPIRRDAPIGAIGNYWANMHRPTPEEISVLQALADTTSVAMENAMLYAQLQEKLRALEESNDELGRFAWIASHDLKSPLRAIGYLSQKIEEQVSDKLDEESKERFAVIDRRIGRMEKMLDDVLAYAQLGHRSPGEAEIVGGDVIIEDIELLVNLPEGFTLKVQNGFKTVRGARLPLQRVFCNLVDNAIKHHDRQAGVIEIGFTQQESKYVFSVRDDGPGIAPRFHDRIFELFQTLQPRDVKEGSGMGLSFVKKIVSLQGGEVLVEPAPERGSVFKFTWPKVFEET